jgi:hypothetical protein
MAFQASVTLVEKLRSNERVLKGQLDAAVAKVVEL